MEHGIVLFKMDSYAHSSPMPVSQLVLVDPRWTCASHCKPQGYNASGRGGARSGRWAPTPGYFSSGGVDTLEDLASGALG